MRGWEIVSEEVARQKVSQCLRDIVKGSTPKLGGGEESRGSTQEALLSEIEVDEATAFIRTSIAALKGQLKELDGESNINYSLNNFVSESCFSSKSPDEEEYACEKQAILRAEQLKNDDSAFHRLIDRMLLEDT